MTALYGACPVQSLILTSLSTAIRSSSNSSGSRMLKLDRDQLTRHLPDKVVMPPSISMPPLSSTCYATSCVPSRQLLNDTVCLCLPGNHSSSKVIHHFQHPGALSWDCKRPLRTLSNSSPSHLHRHHTHPNSFRGRRGTNPTISLRMSARRLRSTEYVLCLDSRESIRQEFFLG